MKEINRKRFIQNYSIIIKSNIKKRTQIIARVVATYGTDMEETWIRESTSRIHLLMNATNNNNNNLLTSAVMTRWASEDCMITE